MKNLIAITLLFLSINIFSQNSANDTLPEKKYVQEKTDYTYEIDGKEYPVYVSRRKNKVYKNGKEILNHVSYYIMRIDEVTGKKYMQLLEMED